MSTPQAQESLRWLQVIASEYVAALKPLEHRDGGLSLDWHNSGIDYGATCNAEGSLFMHAEKVTGEWDEWAETIAAPGPDAEQAVRAFYQW